MNVIEISVEGLLGKFNYKLDLREAINLIHAPNGSGKTKFLMLIDALVNDNFSRVIDIPFKRISFIFKEENEKIYVWNITKYEGKHKADERNNFKKECLITYDLGLYDEDSFGTFFEINISKAFNGDLGKISMTIPELRRVGQKIWVEIETGETLNLKEILNNYGNYEDLFEVNIEYDEEYDDELIDLFEYLPTKLIETNRLYKSKNNNGYFSNTLAISTYSNRIKKELSKNLQLYAKISQELDQTFPNRLLSKMQKDSDREYSLGKILMELVEQDLYRKELSEMGLLNSNDNAKFGINYLKHGEEFNQHYASVLGLFIEDSKKKLAVFNDIKGRIDLFLKYVNNKLMDKKISLDRDNGFIIKFITGERLEKVYQLSSGEQHTIILFFDLLFMSEENSLILIDEPELSLHSAWQMDFLKELEVISKIRNQKYIIATHSPQIVNEYWDKIQDLYPTFD